MRTKRSTTKGPPFTTIERVEDIPVFADEDEEHAFWETHELSDALWDSAEPFEPEEIPARRASTTPVVIHLDGQTLKRLEALARQQQRDYHVLLKEFVAERLYEEEKRSGIVSGIRSR
jgi:hypothetical protein